MPTSAARLGFQNHLENATSITATTEDASFPVANIADWLTSDFFKPTGTGTTNITINMSGPVTADYFAFFNQNLYSLGGTIRLQYHNGSGYVNCFSAISPASNAPQMVTFTAQTASIWRIVITCSSVFSLAIASFGQQLALEYGMYLGWTPPTLGRDTKLINSESDQGSFLGRSIISKGVKSNLVLQYATDAWVRANWPAFILAAEKHGFFFVPDITNHPSEVVFCWTEDGNIPPPAHTHYGYMGVTIPIRGLVE